MRTDSLGPIQSGSGAGIFYLHNEPTDTRIEEPTTDLANVISMWAKNNSSTDDLGLLIKDEQGGKSWVGGRIGINVQSDGDSNDPLTSTVDASLHVRGEGLTSATTALLIENSGSTSTLFEVKNDGTINIPNIGSTTPVTNLGVDASGNVVSGTTGGGGGSGLNYITPGTVATNLELTSNWDINGVYTGSTTATGTQADCHVDSNYWFTCVATDTWIRLIRG